MPYTIENRPEALVVRVPPLKRSWSKYLWSVLLVVWTLLLALAIYRQRWDAILSACGYSIIVLTDFAVLFSQQELKFDGKYLRRADTLFGLSLKSRKAQLERVSKLRYVAAVPRKFFSIPQALAVDLGGREWRVVTHLEKDEVERIIATIRDRFPALR